MGVLYITDKVIDLAARFVAANAAYGETNAEHLIVTELPQATVAELLVALADEASTDVTVHNFGFSQFSSKAYFVSSTNNSAIGTLLSVTIPSSGSTVPVLKNGDAVVCAVGSSVTFRYIMYIYGGSY